MFLTSALDQLASPSGRAVFAIVDYERVFLFLNQTPSSSVMTIPPRERDESAQRFFERALN